MQGSNDLSIAQIMADLFMAKSAIEEAERLSPPKALERH
jgi:hypothetical protein